MTDDYPALIDPMSEQAVVGSLLQQPELAPRVFARVNVSDFTGPPATVLGAVQRMLGAGLRVDPATVLSNLREAGELGLLPNGATYLHTLIQSAWSPMAVDSYVTPVERMARRRRLLAVSTKLGQQAQQQTSDLDAAAIEAFGALEADLEHRGADDEPSPAIEDVLAGPDEAYDWVIPDLLERGERLLLTAPEGLGKSVVIRQIAVCAAAGVHPFSDLEFTPKRVLVIDCENGLRQSRRRFGPLIAKADRMGRPVEKRLRIQIRPEGLDLARPSDAAWLLQRVMVDAPDLLCVGPLYRLHAGDPNDEQLARKLTRALDAARVRGRCALLTEAHANHGQTWGKERDLRPTGSSLWRRWPEMIRALRPVDGDPTIVHVERAGRGDRDPREWPEYLRHGNEEKEWPWTPSGARELAEGVRMARGKDAA